MLVSPETDGGVYKTHRYMYLENSLHLTDLVLINNVNLQVQSYLPGVLCLD